MMSLAVLQQLNEEIATEAADENRLPYVPWDAAEVSRWQTCPVPNLGCYEPEGWEKTETNWFVDSTGQGSEREPALTWPQFRQELSEYVTEHPGHGIAITEEGEMQIVISAFRLVQE